MMDLQIAKAAPAGIYLAFSLALFVWHVGVTLLAAALADRFGIGDEGFQFKGDLKKMAACSLAALLPFLALFYFAPHPAVFLVYLLCLLVSLKAAYLNASHGFLLAVIGGGIAGFLAFAPLLVKLKLAGIYILYVFLFAVLLVLQQRRRRRERERREAERVRELRIRSQARRDPSFITPCYRCAFNRSEGGRCLLKNGGEDVREIKLDQRTLCTSFQVLE